MRKGLPQFYAITGPLEARSPRQERGQSEAVADSSGAPIPGFRFKVEKPPRPFTLAPFFGSRASQDWLAHFERLLASGIELVQLRVKELPAARLAELARYCQAMAADRELRLLLNGPPELAGALGMAGMHLTSRALMASTERPLPEGFLVGASCHSREELRKAEAIGADFACLSPVRPTKGYASGAALGFEGFAALIADCSIPIYGLGGLSRDDLAEIRKAGGQGVAGISAFWR